MIGIILWALNPAHSLATPEKQMPLIIAFGDSLTAGYGVPVGETFPALLQDKIREKGYRYRVVNSGISGETTSGGLSRISDIIRERPEIVILELGANDGFRGAPLDLIRSNLSRSIERLQKENIKILLAGMRIPPNYGETYTSGFHRIYVDLASKYHVRLIPFLLDGVAADERLNQGDGIHPTSEGYKTVSETVWHYLEPMLSKPR